MIRRILMAAMAILAATLIGCGSPSGVYCVIDGRTGDPVSGVKAVLYKDPCFPGPYSSVPPPLERLEESQTDAQGRLRLTHWADGHVIELTRTGYTRTRWELYSIMQNFPSESGNIEMQKEE